MLTALLMRTQSGRLVTTAYERPCLVLKIVLSADLGAQRLLLVIRQQ
jgi:hypothetical protein